MRRIIIAFLTLAFVLPALIRASTPGLPGRNFTIDFSVEENPEKVGDILSVKEIQ